MAHRGKLGSKKTPSKNASVRRASQRVKDAKSAGFRTTSKFTDSVRAGRTARPSSGSTDVSQGTIREQARKVQGGTNVLTPESLRQAKGIVLPNPPVQQVPDVSANNAGLTGGDSTLAVNGNFLVQNPKTDLDKSFNQYQTNLANNKLPSGADIQAQLEKDTNLRQLQQKENQYSAQINSIIANRDANLLRVTGQGRGIPEAIIGGQQAKIQKEAAIAALPVQALLAEAQGNVALAKDHINTWGKILIDDARNKFNYKNALYKSVYDFATAKEKRRLDELDKKSAREFDLQKTNIALANDWAKTAVQYGQSDVAGEIMRLDPTSDTFQKDFANARVQIRKPVAVQGVSAVKAPTVKKINGVDMQWNPQTGAWDEIGTGKTAGTKLQQLASIQTNIEKISNVIDSTALNSTVGTSIVSRSGGGFLKGLGRVASLIGIPVAVGGAIDSLTGEKQNFIADIKQLQSQLSLDSLVNAKANGATFGALSEKELKLLSDSATKLSTWEIADDNGNTIAYNASEKSFKKELDKINRFAKLDYLLKGGTPTDVGVQVQEDGSYWVKNSDGTYSQLQ